MQVAYCHLDRLLGSSFSMIRIKIADGFALNTFVLVDQWWTNLNPDVTYWYMFM